MKIGAFICCSQNNVIILHIEITFSGNRLKLRSSYSKCFKLRSHRKFKLVLIKMDCVMSSVFYQLNFFW